MVEHWNWEMEREGIPEEEIAYPDSEGSPTKLMVKEGVPKEEMVNPDSGGVVDPNLDQSYPEDKAKSMDCDGGGDLPSDNPAVFVPKDEVDSCKVEGEEQAAEQQNKKTERGLNRGCKRRTNHTWCEGDQCYECDKCEYTCYKWDTLTAHKNRKHKWAEADLEFSCEYCDYSCKMRDTLNAHIRRRHRGLPLRNKYKRLETLLGGPDSCQDLFSCDQCEYTCNIKDTLNAHKRRKHKSEKKVKLSTCYDAEFPESAVPEGENGTEQDSFTENILIDMNIQEKEPPYSTEHGYNGKQVVPEDGRQDAANQCELCNYTCEKWNTLLKHKSRHHSKRYNSKESFASQESQDNRCSRDASQMHKTRGHDEPQERTHVLDDQTFFCDQCDYTCTKKDTLNAHRNRKHKEADIGQIFYCEHCDYSCNRRDTLNAHRNRKHREGDVGLIFSCEFCDYSCVVRDTLNAHVRRKHKEKG